MAGTPKRKAWLERIRELGGFNAMFEKRASGWTWAKLAEEIGCSQTFLYTLMGRNEKMREARTIANKQFAEYVAEHSLELIDNAELTREHLEKVKQQVAHRRWLATVYDRERFGEPTDQGKGAPISIGELHIQALIQGAVKPTLPAPPASAGGVAVPATPVAGLLSSGPSVPAEHEPAVTVSEE